MPGTNLDHSQIRGHRSACNRRGVHPDAPCQQCFPPLPPYLPLFSKFLHFISPYWVAFPHSFRQARPWWHSPVHQNSYLPAFPSSSPNSPFWGPQNSTNVSIISSVGFFPDSTTLQPSRAHPWQHRRTPTCPQIYPPRPPGPPKHLKQPLLPPHGPDQVRSRRRSELFHFSESTCPPQFFGQSMPPKTSPMHPEVIPMPRPARRNHSSTFCSKIPR